jgi:RHS repeat-associated protein
MTSSRSRKALLLDIGIIAAAVVIAAAGVGQGAVVRGIGARGSTVLPRPHSGVVATSTSGLGTRGAGPTIPASAAPLPALFTATSRTYKAPEGSYYTTVYATPVNVKEPNGTWTPIEGATTGSSASPSAPAGAAHIDSSVTSGASQDCPLASNSPTTSLCSSTSDTVGYDGTNTDNSLVQFNVKEALPAGSNVLNAELGMYLWQSSTTTPVSVSAYAVTKAWTSAATWNTYDGATAWASPGGDFTMANTVANPSVTTPAGWAHWYPTQIVQEWVNGSLANDGLLLADTTQNTTNDMLSFYSSKATSANKPYLTISWEPRGQEDASPYQMQPFPLDGLSTLKVNLASGDLFVNSTDLAVKGTGIPFLAEHNYDSLDNEGGSVNPWYSLPGASVYHDGSVVIGINRHDFATFIRQSNGKFLTPPGINAKLCEVGKEEGCTGNSVDGSKAVYALTFNTADNGPLYAQGNKIDFGSKGGIWSIADRYGNALAWNYEGKLSIKDTQGRTFTRSTVEVSGSPVTSEWKESGTGGREVKYAYNAKGKLETYTDALGHKTKYAYDEEGELSEITDPRGSVTKLNYDTSHHITKITLAEVGGSHPTWNYAYFEASDTTHGHKCEPVEGVTVTKKTVVTDPNGHESTFCANVLDEVLESFDPAGNKTQAAFNELANPTSGGDASPGTGENEGNVESLVYDEAGSKVSCALTGIPTARKSCTTESGSSPLVTGFEYKDKTNPFLPTQITDPQGHSTFICYNDGKLEEGHEGPECPTPTGPSGAVQKVTDALSSQNEVSFEYNSKGEQTSSKDARGNVTTTEYDASGNLKAAKPPTGSGLKETKVTVDSDSRPHVITDGAGHIETITYDKLDRVTQTAFTGTGTARTVKFEYDADGNVIKREASTGTTKYTFDALNRLTKEALPAAQNNEYGYEAASKMSSFTDSGGTTKYTYNNLDELEAVTEPGETKQTKFAYDGDHRLTKVTYPSGAVENYKLEPTLGRPEAITFEGLSGTAVPNFAYTYTEGENNTELIQSRTESSGSTTTYGYDPLNRLKSAVTIGSGKSGSRYVYNLDGNGNRVSQTVNPTEPEGGETTYYVTNSGNLLECRQTVEGACSKSNSTELSAYSYNEAGEETAITPKGDTSGSTFEFNAASQLSGLTPAGSEAKSLSYGGTGQNDLVSLGSSTTIQNSLLGLTREGNASGTSYYARTPDGRLIDQRTPSGKFNPLYDAQGDVVALVSTSGKVERTFRYGPYGENVSSEGTQTVPYPFGFQGGYRMPGGNAGKGNVANGIDHFGERFYDPTTGRWTQSDPLVGDGEYVFAADDPINLGDPNGLNCGPFGIVPTFLCSVVEAVGSVVGKVVKVASDVVSAAVKIGGKIVVVYCAAYVPIKKALQFRTRKGSESLAQYVANGLAAAAKASAKCFIP